MATTTAFNAWEPDAVVGIDFGMTCTAVGYSIGPDWPPPKCIQRWPNRLGTPLANKVPSQISYGPDEKPKCWGFLCDPSENGVEIEELFKLYLNPEFEDNYPGRPTHQEARRLFKDYMRCIYNFTEEYFSWTVPRWTERKVEYLFSIPTNWLNPALCADIESLVRRAGFARDPSKARIRIAMTEAEAAAVYAAKQQFEVGDVILVCDAGGATTDLNILKVRATGQTTELRALNTAEGIDVGSALIDMQMEKFIAERLAAFAGFGGEDERHEIARAMIREDDFQTAKHAFGSEGADWPTIPLSVPGLRREIRAPDIENGVLRIRKDKLQELFDEQVQKLFAYIDRQIRALEVQQPNERISYLVLSGGLGSSEYVQKRINSRYIIAPLARNAHEMKLMFAPEPQLAVVQGLVMDRIQAIERGRNIYQGRHCRTSFGVVVREPYEELRHRGQKVTVDPLDKMKWAEDQIDWLVKKGKKIPDEGIQREYRLKIPLGDEDETWQAEIVMSSSPRGRLPTSIQDDNVRRVCLVEAVFSQRTLHNVQSGKQQVKGFSLMNSHWWQKGHPYILAVFDIYVLVGSADIRFQLKTKDGKRFSEDHPEIEVSWEQAAPRAAAEDGNMAKMYHRRQRRRRRR